jgi:hypothetical protein
MGVTDSRETQNILALITQGNIYNEQKVADLTKMIGGGTQKMPKISRKWLFTPFGGIVLPPDLEPKSVLSVGRLSYKGTHLLQPVPLGHTYGGGYHHQEAE